MTARATCVCALMLLAWTAGAAELGRLFFTPEQRATLDKARQQNNRAEVGTENEQPAAPVPQNISVDGVIRRSDGKSTIWLNNRVVGEQLKSGVKATARANDSRVRLSVPDSGRDIDLKVGQTVEIVSGTVAENYLRRPAANVAVKPAAGRENRSSDAAKGPPPAPPDAKTEPPPPIRPARAAQRGGTDDVRAGDVDAK
jgi:hypothetical protein